MKKTAFLTVLLLGVFLAAGCADRNTNPRYVLSKYLDASLHGREKEAYKYLSSADKTAKHLPPTEDAAPRKESVFRQVIYDNITYKIDSMKAEGDKAEAMVTITTPDFGVMFRDIHAAAFGSISQETLAPGELDGILAERYKDRGLPMTTTAKNFSLVKEGDRWKVILGLEPDELDENTMEAYFTDVSR
ncbi:MAG: hypothetical protein HQ594_04720 [Candidatus Omnitrophica bacterium]|nr:hypothetical protein [Candidatus Omnitrophota bacterium]